MHGSISALQWVVNIYTIPLASVLLTAGNISDRWGGTAAFIWSLASFTGASLLCALSTSLGFLVAARALQGLSRLGACCLRRSRSSPALTPTQSSAPRRITLWGATGGLALVAGPIGGGVLTELLAGAPSS